MGRCGIGALRYRRHGVQAAAVFRIHSAAHEVEVDRLGVEETDGCGVHDNAAEGHNATRREDRCLAEVGIGEIAFVGLGLDGGVVH